MTAVFRNSTWIRPVLLASVLAAATPVACRAGPDGDDRSALIMERYEQMLRDRPREGTALERLYRTHVDRMDVADWLAALSEAASAPGADAGEALLAALAFRIHGEDGPALEALALAEDRDPSDWYAPFLRGRIHFRARAYEEAAAAFDVAADRAADPDDRATVFRELGRTWFRAGNLEAGQSAWERLAELNPGDTDVLEELGDLLREEGNPDAAQRYYRQALERGTLPAYRDVRLRIKLAGLCVELDDIDTARRLYEDGIERIDPEHWLYEEILDRIDAMYRHDGDEDGWVAWYRSRLEAYPHESALVLRFASACDEVGRPEQALAALESAVSRAPSRVDLRRALALRLAAAGRHRDAIGQWERVVRQEPESVEHRLDLARTWMEWADAPEREKHAEAWVFGIRDVDPTDPGLAVRAADALRDLGLTGAVRAPLEQAVALAPGRMEYRERLADFLLGSGRREDARRVLLELDTVGDTDARMRLPDALAVRGFEEDALAAARRVAAMQPNFETRLALVSMLGRVGAFEEALAELDALVPDAPNAYFRDDLTDRRIHLLRRVGRLDAAFAEWEAGVEAAGGGTEEDWMVGVRMALARGDTEASRRWAARLTAGSGVSPRALKLAERVHRRLGDIDAQVAVLEQRAKAGPPDRADALRQLVDVHESTGDLEAALHAAERLVRAEPARPDGYRLAARVLQAMGEDTEAFSRMREAIRVAPGEPAHRLHLAAMLAERFQLPEAIEMYWQALEAADPSGQLAVIPPLAGLYDDQNRFGELEERLRRWQRRDADSVVPGLALVRAYEAVEDRVSAVQELERVAARFPDNSEILGRLVRVLEDQGESEAALDAQRRLVRLAPSARNFERLGEMQIELGLRAEALASWQAAMDRMGTGTSPRQVDARLEWIERLNNHGFEARGAEALEALRLQSAGDWRIELRVAIALLEVDRIEDAFALLRKVAVGPLDGEPGAEAPEPVAGLAGQFLQHRYPEEYVELQHLSRARWTVFNPSSRSIRNRTGIGALTPERGRAMAIATLASLEGMSPAVDAWWQGLFDGTPAERRLALKLAVVVQDPEITRDLAARTLEENPEDGFARMVLMTPSRGEARSGYPRELFERVADHLGWFRRNRPGPDWFYDWYELRFLVGSNDRARVREWVEAWKARGQGDPFLVAQMTSLFERAQLYGLVDQYVEEAVAYYRENGLVQMADSLLASLGPMSVQAIRQGDIDLGVRLLARALDATRPQARSPGVITRPASARLDDASFPAETTWWDAARLNTLRQGYTILAKVGRVEALSGLLESRIGSGEDPESVGPLLGLAYLRWWEGDARGCGRLLTRALESAGHPDELRLLTARYLEETGQPDRALAMIQALDLRFGPLYRDSRWWVLNLALETGDDEVARDAARDLYRMRLPPDQTLELADGMALIGMADEAELLERRAERLDLRARTRGSGSGGRSLVSRVERMEAAYQRGDVEQAERAALQCLRAAPSAPRFEQTEYRQQALMMLKRLGRLQPLMDAYRAELRTGGPDLARVETLFTMYRFAGRPEAADTLLQDHLARDERSAELRLRLARQFCGDGEFEAAIEHLDVLLEQAPSVFFGPAPEYWLLTQAYTGAGMPDRLLDAVRRMPMDRLGAGGRSYRSGREQVIGNLVNFAKDCLAGSRLPAELPLVICEKLDGVLSPAPVRNRYAIPVLELKARALIALGRDAEAFEVLAECVLTGSVREAFVPAPGRVRRGNPVHGMGWKPEGADGLILELVRAADRSGSLDRLRDAAEAAWSHGDDRQAFLVTLVRIEQGQLDGIDEPLDQALSVPAVSPGTDGGAWALLSQGSLIGTALASHGRHELAMDAFRRTLDLSSRRPGSGMDNTLLNYLVASAMEAGRTAEARDAVLAYVEAVDAEAGLVTRAAPPRPVQARLFAMKKLAALGFRREVVRIGHQVLNEPVSPYTRHMVQQVETILQDVKRGGPPADGGPAGWEAWRRETEAALEAAPHDPVLWEQLLWAAEASGDLTNIAAVHGRIEAAFPDDAGWRARLAQSALEAGVPGRAADYFAEVLSLDPAEVLATRNSYRDLVRAYQESHRMRELVSRVGALDLESLVLDPGVSRTERLTIIQELVYLSGYGLRPAVDAPRLTLDIASRLRPLIERRPSMATFREQIDTQVLAAIRRVPMDPGERFRRLAALALPAGVLPALGLDPAEGGSRGSWWAGRNWGARAEGVVPALMDAAKAVDRLDDLIGVLAGAGEPEMAWLHAIGRLAGGSELGPDRLDQAREGLQRAQGSAEDRAYGLALLADALAASGQTGPAADAMAAALERLGRAGAMNAWLLVRGELGGILRRLDREDEACALMEEVPPYRRSATSADQYRDMQSQARLDGAGHLVTWDRIPAAWMQAILARDTFHPDMRHHRRTEAQRVIDRIEENHAEELVGDPAGLEHIVEQVRSAYGDNSIDALDHLARLYRLAGEDRVAEALVSARGATLPSDVMTRLRLAELYVDWGQPGAASREFEAVLDSAPGILLGDPERALVCMQAGHAAGRLDTMIPLLTDPGLDRLLAGVSGGDGARGPVVRTLLELARAAMRPPISSDAAAGALLGMFDWTSPATRPYRDAFVEAAVLELERIAGAGPSRATAEGWYRLLAPEAVLERLGLPARGWEGVRDAELFAPRRGDPAYASACLAASRQADDLDRLESAVRAAFDASDALRPGALLLGCLLHRGAEEEAARVRDRLKSARGASGGDGLGEALDAWVVDEARRLGSVRFAETVVRERLERAASARNHPEEERRVMELADLLEANGRPEAARDLLETYPFPRDPTGLSRRERDALQVDFAWNAARRLITSGGLLEAWVRIRSAPGSGTGPATEELASLETRILREEIPELAERGKLDGLVKRLRTELERQPDRTHAWELLAWCEQAAGRWAAARDAAAHALDLRTEGAARLAALLAESSANAERYTEAVDYYRRACAENRDALLAGYVSRNPLVEAFAAADRVEELGTLLRMDAWDAWAAGAVVPASECAERLDRAVGIALRLDMPDVSRPGLARAMLESVRAATGRDPGLRAVWLEASSAALSRLCGDTGEDGSGHDRIQRMVLPQELNPDPAALAARGGPYWGGTWQWDAPERIRFSLLTWLDHATESGGLGSIVRRSQPGSEFPPHCGYVDALIQMRRGDIDAATEALQRVLPAVRGLADRDWTPGEMELLTVLAVEARTAGMQQSAIEIFERAEQVEDARCAQKQLRIADLRIFRAATLADLGRVPEAVALLREGPSFADRGESATVSRDRRIRYLAWSAEVLDGLGARGPAVSQAERAIEDAHPYRHRATIERARRVIESTAAPESH